MFKKRIIDYMIYCDDIKTEFYSQKNSFLNGVRAEKSKKKNQILFRSTSSINGKIRNANYIL